ncbi:MAG: hypothetical protein ACFB5Z_16075 [Elainellaceae cyanobacterium]
MAKSSSKETPDNQARQSQAHQSQGGEPEQDFFEKLQEKEAKQGKAARGKGHGWTTAIETLLGDW